MNYLIIHSPLLAEELDSLTTADILDELQIEASFDSQACDDYITRNNLDVPWDTPTYHAGHRQH